MIEAVMGFVAGIFGSWIFLLGVFFFAILSETKDKLGWSIFLGIVTAVSFYMVIGLTALTGLGWPTLLAAYVSGGIAHSIWRWFRSTAILTEKFNDDVSGYELDQVSDYVISRYKDATNFRENLDKITYWIVAWPISGAAHFLGDVVNVIQKAVTKFFSGIFDRISERARGKATIDVSKF